MMPNSRSSKATQNNRWGHWFFLGPSDEACLFACFFRTAVVYVVRSVFNFATNACTCIECYEPSSRKYRELADEPMQVLEKACVGPETRKGLEQLLVPPQNKVFQEPLA